MKETLDYNMVNVKENIVEILRNLGISYEKIVHEPVFTMEEAEKACGHTPSEGVKTLLLASGKGELYLAVLRGDNRLDFKKIKEVLKTKKISLADSEEVHKIGVTEGALTPFGYGVKIPVLLDSSIFEEKSSYINPGVNTETFKLKSEDLSKAITHWATKVYAI